MFLGRPITDISIKLKSPRQNRELLDCIAFAREGSKKDAFTSFVMTILGGKDSLSYTKGGPPPEYFEIMSMLCDAVTGETSVFPDQTYIP